MNVKEAMDILSIQSSISSFDEITKAYRVACMKYHPDRGGSDEMMKAVNLSYNFLQNVDFSNIIEVFEESTSESFGDILNSAINAIKHIEGLEIEVCGTWLWVGGKTYPHRAILKDLGFNWAPDKKRWYLKSEFYVKTSAKTLDIERIREIYGSTDIKKNVKSRVRIKK